MARKVSFAIQSDTFQTRKKSNSSERRKSSVVESSLLTAAAIITEDEVVHYDENYVRQLLPHVPDNVIDCDHRIDMPYSKEFIGVAMFADISGFTSLCERFADMATKDSACGTDKLTATLNSYIGKIVDVIVKNGGDVLKFAGDAILVSWRCSDIINNIQSVLTKVIRCSFEIQNQCDNYMTEVGVLLRVKIALAVGTMCITYVGVKNAKQFDLSGSAVNDVGKTEKKATPGDVILSRLAWVNCNQSLFQAKEIDDGLYYQVSEKSYNVTSKAFAIGQLLAGALTDFPSITADESIARIQEQEERIVTCPELDPLVDKCIDYRKDMPKALIVHETEDIMASMQPLGIKSSVLPKKKRKNKKFDRISMSHSITDTEVADLRAYVPVPVLYKLPFEKIKRIVTRSNDISSGISFKLDHGQDLEWLSEMRQVSVLFINLKLPSGAKESTNALQKAFEVIYESTEKYEGNLNKVFSFDKGCTFVVIFGLPGLKHEDDAARALKCGHLIYEAFHAISEITDESIGVTTGKTFCGVVGHQDRHEYTVIGRKVNMAARLMTNYPGLLSCDQETFEGARNRLKKRDFVQLPFKELKGIKDPGIVREFNPNNRCREDNEKFNLPLLGRKSELEVLSHLLDEVESSKGIFATIEGDAGSGKTRLVEAFIEKAKTKDFRVNYFELDNFQALTPYFVVRLLLSTLLGLEKCKTFKEKEAKIQEQIESKSLREDLSLLNDLLGLQFHSREEICNLNDTERSSLLHQTAKKLIQQVTKTTPHLLVIDNGHRTDANSWSFFQDFVTESNVILISVMVPFKEEVAVQSSVAKNLINSSTNKRITLGGLEDCLLADLACQLLKVTEVPKALNAVLVEQSGGLASWCEQVLQDLVMTGKLVLISKQNYLIQHRHGKVGGSRQSSELSMEPSAEKFHTIGALMAEEYLKYRRKSSLKSELGTSAMKVILEHKEMANDNSSTEISKGHEQLKIAEDIHDNRRMSSNIFDIELLDYKETDFIKVSDGILPIETDDICFIAPGTDISKISVPNSVKDMIVARLDKMSPNDQLILKCASVLGTSFTRDVLKAIVPRKSVNVLDTTLYKLTKDHILECGSLPNGSSKNESDESGSFHPHGYLSSQPLVLCGCYADEGYNVINLSQTNTFGDGKKRVCLYFRFSNLSTQEASYALWLEDQKKALHERAAMYLETQSHKCKACGGSAFLPQNFSPVGYRNGRAHNKSSGYYSSSSKKRSSRASHMHSLSSKKSRRSHLMSTYISSDAVKAHHTGQKEGDWGIFDSEQIVRSSGENIGQALVDMANLVTKGSITGKEVKRKFSIKWKKNKVTPSVDKKFIARTLLGEFRKSMAVFEDDNGFKSTQARQTQEHFANQIFKSNAIDLAKCCCSEILCMTLPQLLRHWKVAGNHLKTFHYLNEAACAYLTVDDNIQALSYLDDVETTIKSHEKDKREQDFVVTKEEKARSKCLVGQALVQMNRIDEALPKYYTALKYLKIPQPSTQLGAYRRTKIALMVQTLHQKMPGVFHDRGGEISELLIEQAKCMSQLYHACHAKKDYSRAFMFALQQLNLVEEAEENWHELMTAYTNILESCLAVKRIKLGRLFDSIATEKAKHGSPDVDDALTVGNFFCVALEFRLSTGELLDGIKAGTNALEIARSLNSLTMKMVVIPLIAQALILQSRVHFCHDVLNELKLAAEALNNQDALAMYYSCCLDLILEPGQAFEPVENCIKEASVLCNDPSSSCDSFCKFYLNAGLALLFARQEKWEKAKIHYSKVKDSQDTPFSVFLHCHGVAKMVEYELLLFRKNPKDIEMKRRSKQILRKLEKLCKQCKLFRPRLFHLQAYFAILRQKTSRAMLLLEDCGVESKNVGTTFEGEWMQTSKRKWMTPKDGQDPFPLSGSRIDALFALPKVVR